MVQKNEQSQEGRKPFAFNLLITGQRHNMNTLFEKCCFKNCIDKQDERKRTSSQLGGEATKLAIH